MVCKLMSKMFAYILSSSYEFELSKALLQVVMHENTASKTFYKLHE